MSNEITYNVRVYKTEVSKGAKGTSYKVRWRTERKRWKVTFRKNASQADSFRSALLTAARNGEAFSLATGRPVSWRQEEPGKEPTSWYAFAGEYAAAKWPYVSPNQRRSIGEALTDTTEAMFATEDQPYERAEIRRALRTWAFSARLRGLAKPPADIAAIVLWLEAATIPVADLARTGDGAARSRALLDRISKNRTARWPPLIPLTASVLC